MIIEANKEENSNKPYFLILDEMNLSHVERYFADFLSVMESGEAISLHADMDDWQDEIPASIKLPTNLFIVGTVNIDETTYMFSPKVLDRASVIEFRVTEEEMNDYLKNKTKLNLDELKGAGAAMAGSFVTIANDKELAINDDTKINETLIAFFRELKKTGAEFGYRSASEILRFAAVANKIAPTWTDTHIIDASIMQKLLPKVHGSRRKLEPVLRALAGLCVVEGKKADEYLSGKKEIISANETEVKYPVSLEKIVRMYNNLLNNGFTSYAEA
jgi:5-methylcytosine-specific restriction protein B